MAERQGQSPKLGDARRNLREVVNGCEETSSKAFMAHIRASFPDLVIVETQSSGAEYASGPLNGLEESVSLIFPDEDVQLDIQILEEGEEATLKLLVYSREPLRGHTDQLLRTPDVLRESYLQRIRDLVERGKIGVNIQLLSGKPLELVRAVLEEAEPGAAAIKDNHYAPKNSVVRIWTDSVRR